MNLIKRFIRYYKKNGLLKTLRALAKKIYWVVRNKITRNVPIKQYVEYKYKNFELSLAQGEKRNIILKNNSTVYIFATVPYYDVRRWTKVFTTC